MSAEASPVKPAKLPPAVATASQDELQKMVVDLLRKCKAKDKKLAELSGQAVKVNGVVPVADQDDTQALRDQIAMLHQAVQQRSMRPTMDDAIMVEEQSKLYTSQLQQLADVHQYLKHAQMQLQDKTDALAEKDAMCMRMLQEIEQLSQVHVASQGEQSDQRAVMEQMHADLQQQTAEVTSHKEELIHVKQLLQQAQQELHVANERMAAHELQQDHAIKEAVDVAHREAAEQLAREQEHHRLQLNAMQEQMRTAQQQINAAQSELVAALAAARSEAAQALTAAHEEAAKRQDALTMKWAQQEEKLQQKAAIAEAGAQHAREELHGQLAAKEQLRQELQERLSAAQQTYESVLAEKVDMQEQLQRALYAQQQLQQLVQEHADVVARLQISAAHEEQLKVELQQAQASALATSAELEALRSIRDGSNRAEQEVDASASRPDGPAVPASAKPTQLNARQEMVAATTARAEAAEAQLARMESELGAARDEVERLQAELMDHDSGTGKAQNGGHKEEKPEQHLQDTVGDAQQYAGDGQRGLDASDNEHKIGKDKLAEELHAAQSQIVKLEAELAEAKGSAAALQEAQNRILSLEGQLEQTESELSVMREQEQNMKATLQGLQASLQQQAANAEFKSAELAEAMHQEEAHAADLRSALEKAAMDAEHLQRRLADAQHEIANAKDAAALTQQQLEQQLQESQSQAEQLRTACDEHEMQLRKLHQQLEGSQSEAEQLRLASAENERRLQELQAQLEAAEGRVNELNARAASGQEAQTAHVLSLEQQIEEQSAALTQAKQDVQRLQQQLKDVHKQVSVLQEQADVANAALAGSKAEADVQLAGKAQEMAALKQQLAAAQEMAAARASELECKAETAAGTAARLEGELAAALSKVESLNARVAATEGSMESQVDKWTCLLEEREAAAAAAEKSAAESRCKLQEMEKRLGQLAGEHEAAIAQLQADAEVKAAQLAEASSREGKLAEQLASLTERAAQLGELPVLRSAAETAKGDLVRLKKEHDAEREKVKKAIQEMKRKVDRAQKDKAKAEAIACECKTEAAAAVEGMRGEVMALQEQVLMRQQKFDIVDAELKDYKARATALLKAKDLEIKAARDQTEHTNVAEVSELKAALASAQEHAQDLAAKLRQGQETWNSEYNDFMLHYDGQLRSIQDELQAQQEAAETYRRSADVWKRKYDSLAAEYSAIKQPVEDLKRELEAAQKEGAAALASLATLKTEYEAFRETSIRLAEAKDAEVSRLLELNALLRSDTSLAAQRLSSMPDDLVSHAGSKGASAAYLEAQAMASAMDGMSRPSQSQLGMDTSGNYDEFMSAGGFDRRSVGPSVSEMGDGDDHESRLVKAAERQATRDKEMEAVLRRARHLELEVQELERECELRQQQEAALKEALRDIERERKREQTASSQVDMAYLKNVILKLFETGQKDALLPVVAMIMQFSPAEMQRCRAVIDAEKAAADIATQGSGLVADSSSGDVSAYFSSLTKSFLGS